MSDNTVNEAPQVTRSNASKFIAGGLLMLGLAIALSVGSYMIAADGGLGGRYAIFGGLAFCGIVALVRGMIAAAKG
jgi:hypothetical protein